MVQACAGIFRTSLSTPQGLRIMIDFPSFTPTTKRFDSEGLQLIRYIWLFWGTGCCMSGGDICACLDMRHNKRQVMEIASMMHSIVIQMKLAKMTLSMVGWRGMVHVANLLSKFLILTCSNRVSLVCVYALPCTR